MVEKESSADYTVELLCGTHVLDVCAQGWSDLVMCVGVRVRALWNKETEKIEVSGLSFSPYLCPTGTLWDD